MKKKQIGNNTLSLFYIISLEEGIKIPPRYEESDSYLEVGVCFRRNHF